MCHLNSSISCEITWVRDWLNLELSNPGFLNCRGQAMEIGILETRYTDSCRNYGSTPNDFILLAFAKAKLLKSLNEACTLEINIDKLAEDKLAEIDFAPLTEVFSLVNLSEVDAVDVLHTSRCIIANGQELLTLMRCIGPKLRTVDLKDVSFGKDALRDLLERGLPCQILNLSSCRTRKLNMTGQFLALHTMNLDFNVSVTSLPEGCFSSMPKLRRLSMCETRIANFWTTVAALSKLPSLSELRFQNCLCCNDTGQCPLSSTEKTNSFVHESLSLKQAMEWSSIDHESVRFPDSESSETDAEAFHDIFSDDESVMRRRLVHSSGEDSSDESVGELQFHLRESIPLEDSLADIQQTDFLGNLSREGNGITDMEFNDANTLVQQFVQVRAEERFFETDQGFSSREGGLMSIRDRGMLGNISDVSGNSFDNTVSLDAFYDAAETSTPLRASAISNGEGTSGDELNSEDSVMLAGIALRRNASHHPSSICFEKYYREFMIASLPGLRVLDNLPVTQLERERARTVFEQHFESLPYNRREKENVFNILKERETGIGSGILLPCKQKRLGTSNGNAISFSRSICAAKMASCAWPATYPISKLKRNSTENSTEINKKFRPRQFEYHPSDSSLMVFGTLDGEVVVINHESGKIVGHVQSVGANHSILGLCWLNKDPTKLIAGSDNGTLQLYDVNRMRSTVLPSRYGAGSSSRNPATYTYEEFEQLTSVHINATDNYFLASGYSKHVALYDVCSGKRLQVFEDLHREHINVVKFAHHSPYMFATSSFDQEIKMWDLRQKPTHPLYTTTSLRGNVMVCFSRDDHYILSSAVDNEVKQHLAVDGRLHMKFDIAPTGSAQNYTRSYYMNGRDYIISGSCEENVVRICCAQTGRRLKDLALEGRGLRSSLYVQSLRGDPFRDFHLSVLAAYLHPDSKSEILKINLLSSDVCCKDHSFDLQYLPFSGMGG